MAICLCAQTPALDIHVYYQCPSLRRYQLVFSPRRTLGGVASSSEYHQAILHLPTPLPPPCIRPPPFLNPLSFLLRRTEVGKTDQVLHHEIGILQVLPLAPPDQVRVQSPLSTPIHNPIQRLIPSGRRPVGAPIPLMKRRWICVRGDLSKPASYILSRT